MVPLTRRRLLHGAAGFATVLARCNSLSGADESTRTPTHAIDDTDAGSGNRTTSEPETFRLRVDSERLPVWFADTDDQSGRPTFTDRGRHLRHEIIDDADRADRLEIADVSNAEQAASFIAATDFDSETLYLETYRIKECFELELCHIAWQPDHVETDYARTIRPYDARCGVDEWAIESWLIRIPDAIVADDVNSYSASVGAGSCRPTGSRAEADGEGGNNTSRVLAHPIDRRGASESRNGGGR